MKGLKLNKTIIYNIIIIVLVVWIVRLYNKEEEQIVIPSQENTMTSENPVAVIRVDTIFNDSIHEVLKVVEVENPVNEELFAEYEEAVRNNDSLKQVILFKDAVTERRYKEIYEDTIQIITVESDVVGTLLNQTVNYKTKPRIVSIKHEKNKLEVFGGGFVYSDFEETVFGAALSLENKDKNKIFTFGYDTKKCVHVGVTFKLF